MADEDICFQVSLKKVSHFLGNKLQSLNFVGKRFAVSLSSTGTCFAHLQNEQRANV